MCVQHSKTEMWATHMYIHMALIHSEKKPVRIKGCFFSTESKLHATLHCYATNQYFIQEHVFIKTPDIQ